MAQTTLQVAAGQVPGSQGGLETQQVLSPRYVSFVFVFTFLILSFLKLVLEVVLLLLPVL